METVQRAAAGVKKELAGRREEESACDEENEKVKAPTRRTAARRCASEASLGAASNSSGSSMRARASGFLSGALKGLNYDVLRKRGIFMGGKRSGSAVAHAISGEEEDDAAAELKDGRKTKSACDSAVLRRRHIGVAAAHAGVERPTLQAVPAAGRPQHEFSRLVAAQEHGFTPLVRAKVERRDRARVAEREGARDEPVG